MKFSKADTRRIMDAFEDYIQGFTVIADKDVRRHRRIFAGLLTRKQAAPWRESSHREKNRKLPLK